MNRILIYRTDGFPHSVIPEFNKLLELLGEKTGAYQATWRACNPLA